VVGATSSEGFPRKYGSWEQRL